MTDRPSWQGIVGTTTERGYGHAWRKLREVVLARDEGFCVECRARGLFVAGNHVDHIKPKAEGGGDELTNLQLLCADCHTDKSQAEGARAQGRRGKRKRPIGSDGWPV